MDGASVLVVEDERIVARDLEQTLLGAGYRVPAVVNSGREAIEQAGAHRPELVLMDIVLKEPMDGIEAAREIRDRFQIPVVYLTAYADEALRERAKATVPLGYLVKPVGEQQLLASLDVMLHAHRLAAAPPREPLGTLRGEAVFETILRAAPDAILIVDRDGRILMANTQAETMFGYAREELAGTVVETPMPERYHSRHAEYRQEYGRAPRTRFMGAGAELTGRRKDGSEFPLEISLSAWRDTTAGIRVTAVARDLTTRKQADEALRKSEARFRNLFENVPVGVYQSTRAGRFLDVNSALVAMLGFESREALLATPVADVYAVQNDRDAVVAQLDRAGEVRGIEVTFRRRDGRPGRALLHSRAVRDAGGAVQHYEGTLTDVTEIRRLEDELQQAQRVEAIGRLAGGIAHDFNNLLTVILGYTDAALAVLPAGAPVRGDLEEVKAAGVRAATLTKQLLAFGRRQLLQPQVLDLNEVIVQLAGMLKRLIRENVGLVTICAPELGAIHADRGQLEQVIVNLVVNAGDAMPGGGRLTIETQEVDLGEGHAREHPDVKPGRYILLAVSDTGHGMDAETRARVFEPFFTTKPSGKGAGLGLATVYGIVKQSGGHVWVDSEPGRGTTFRIYLHRMDDVAPAPPTEPRDREGDASGTETVLVVEDESAIRELVRLVLEKHGYRVLVTASAVEAVRLASSHPSPIHLLLTDVVLTDRSGPELAEDVGALLGRGVKVLYMSGYTGNAVVQGFSKAGAAFLQKPFDQQVLVRKVREILDTPGA